MFNRHGEPASGLKTLGINAPITYFDHHYCHNASAYYASGFDAAYAVSIDAFGDCFSSRIYKGANGRLDLMRTIPAYHSPAHHYAYVTGLLGFIPTRHEGKVTGLAAFGDPTETARIIGERITYSTRWKSPIVRGWYHKPEPEYPASVLKPFSKED